ncbi:hypothetical protein BpHYR1_054624 [Brachionus plicatilis]|uniref:Uncharacterized protein n=1 Tax=Brachionus plicatilis TaxID=10195 RepID=A0A3M7QYV0_BRAPC|nr:hypothetical protein BpHYR1_054624 [Brachionus plicatilis]
MTLNDIFILIKIYDDETKFILICQQVVSLIQYRREEQKRYKGVEFFLTNGSRVNNKELYTQTSVFSIYNEF